MDSETTSQGDPAGGDSARVGLTCHAAIFSIVENQLLMLLAERNEGPFRFQWELPGSTPQPHEGLPAAATRACTPLLDTNLPLELRQLGAYADPGRDPRQRAVAVVYWGVVNNTDPGDVLRNEASVTRLVPVNEFTSDDFRFAFDHQQIATNAVTALQQTLNSTSLATRLCSPHFTISELQRVYEAVFNSEIAAGNFHRKVQNTPGFATAAKDQGRGPKGKGRPAQRFEAADIVDVSPPFHFESHPKN
ncbi:MAG TPA: NUDIX domain-containing protein [Acidimicrobiales bacterium]|nr:NUDIX domain-containing protein [Acidimicrobiales bacterium]